MAASCSLNKQEIKARRGRSLKSLTSLYTVLYCRSTQTHFSAHEVVLCLLQVLVGVILLAYRQNTTRTATGISKTVQFVSIPGQETQEAPKLCQGPPKLTWSTRW